MFKTEFKMPDGDWLPEPKMRPRLSREDAESRVKKWYSSASAFVRNNRIAAQWRVVEAKGGK